MSKSNLLRRFLVLFVMSILFYSGIVKVGIISEASELSQEINNFNTNIEQESNTATSDQTHGIHVDYHSQEEIREFVRRTGATIEDAVVYETPASLKSPYSPGSLTRSSLESAVGMLNQVRYIAGLSYNIGINEEYNRLAQAASLVNQVNNELTHYPSQPSDMESSLYEAGALGAGKSNIGMGHETINASIIQGYMEDGDESNIDRVGHRRWILNPEMTEAGFGFCGNYTALYVFDKVDSDLYSSVSTNSGVVWPAQNMPTDYFGTYYPWSISTEYEINRAGVHVRLERLSDQRVWEFSDTKRDGYFNVNNEGYGQTGCIIFRPEKIEDYKAGDEFRVTITGLNEPVSYKVSFFDLVPVEEISVSSKYKKVVKGDSLHTEFHILPSNASNKNVILSSEDEDIIRIEKDNTIRTKKFGIARVTAKSESGDVNYSYEIQVVPDSPYTPYLNKTKKRGEVQVHFSKMKGVSGYELLYSTDSKFKKNVKKLVIKKANSSKAIIKGLQKKKKYYFKMRAFVKVNGKKLYGDYSYPDTYKLYR